MLISVKRDGFNLDFFALVDAEDDVSLIIFE
jgi:hypothetical protein